MVPEPGRLLDVATGAVADRTQRRDIVRAEAQRLLTQDVLARFHRPSRPLHVEVVRQRHVHGVDVGVGEQLVVGPVNAAVTELPVPRILSRVPVRAVA